MKEKILSRFHYVGFMLLFLVGLLFLAVGISDDLSIAESLYKEDSLVADALNLLGPFLFYVVFGAAGACFGLALVDTSEHDMHGSSMVGKRSWKRFLPYLLTIPFSLISGGIYGGFSLYGVFDSLAVSIVIGIIVVLIVDLAIAYAGHGLPRELCFRMGTSILLTSIFVFSFSSLLGVASMRPAYVDYLAELSQEIVEEEATIIGFVPFLDFDAGRVTENVSFAPLSVMGAASSLTVVPLLVALYGKKEWTNVIATAVFFVFSFIAPVGELLSGTAYLSDAGLSMVIGSLVGCTFTFALLEGYRPSDVRPVKVRKVKPTPAVIRETKIGELAYEDTYALRLRRKSSRIHGVYPHEMKKSYHKAPKWRRTYKKRP